MYTSGGLFPLTVLTVFWPGGTTDSMVPEVFFRHLNDRCHSTTTHRENGVSGPWVSQRASSKRKHNEQKFIKHQRWNFSSLIHNIFQNSKIWKFSKLKSLVFFFQCFPSATLKLFCFCLLDFFIFYNCFKSSSYGI